MLVRIDTHLTPAILSRRTALLAGLGLMGCKQAPTHQRVDPALAPLVPADTTMLIGMRLDHLRKLDAWKQLFPEGRPSVLDSLGKKTGIDVQKSIYEVVYCMGGKHPTALIHGKFVDDGMTNGGMEPQLKIEGAQKMPYKGFSLVGKEEYAVMFYNASVAVAGNAAALRAVIDSRELKHTVPEGLLAMVAALPPDGDLYLVTSNPKIPEGGIGGLKSLPLTLSRAWVYADLRTGAAVRGEAEGASDDDAKKMVDGVKAMTSLLRMTLKPAQKDMLQIIDALQLYQDGAKVKMQADLPLELLLKMLDGIDLGGGVRA